MATKWVKNVDAKQENVSSKQNSERKFERKAFEMGGENNFKI